MTLLEFRDVGVTYRSSEGDVPAVRGVTLAVDRGQSLGLAGESGCGKTTLTSTVLRLLPPGATVTGEVLLDGEDVTTMSFGALRAVRWAKASVVFQGAMHSLNPVQRVGDQIAEPILLHDEQATPASARARVAALLEQVGLPGRRASDYPHQLSGGQKQRVMIAMALACGPDLVIADEPTTALDVMVQAQVLALVTGLVKELGVGLVMVSHDLSVLGTTCDRVAVMYAGRVVEEGPALQVFDTPEHPYTAALAGAFPRVGDPAARMAPRGLGGDPPYPGDLPTGCAFHPRCPVALPECSSVDIDLRRTGPGRLAAVRPGRGGGAVTGTDRSGAGGARAGGAVPCPQRRRHGARRRRRRPRRGARRDPRAGRRERLRQDHAGPHAPGPGASERWRGPVRGRAAGLLDPRAQARTGARSSWSCRTRAGRSTLGRPCTSRSRRGCGSTGSPATRRRRSRRRCRAPGSARRSGSSCATRTSCPVASGSAS